MSNAKNVLVVLLFAVIVVIIGKVVKLPVNNKNIVDTDIQIVKTNDSLKIEVNNLDSIKDAKVIEVQKLDNDSTVKLFYKLIK